MRRLASRLVTGFRSTADVAPRAWQVPEGSRVYAIGDIHGRLDLLADLVTRIERDDATREPARTTFVFLGDLVDRGPDSRGVIEFLLTFARGGLDCVFLAGNHDEVFALAASGSREAAASLHRMGGRETAMSYGITPDEYDRGSFSDLAVLLEERVPREHVAFINSFRDWYQLGDYVFVHAGIRPNAPMRDQRSGDLRWIRSSFLDHRDSHGFMVVHGHTITADADVRTNRIGIDTGAFQSGKLTALGLQGGTRWLLST